MKSEKKVYVVILNWNSWQDTIECIESVLKSDYKNFQIIVIDNNSQDNSVNYIIRYLNRELFPKVSNETKFKDKIVPFYEGKIPYVIYSEKEAIEGGDTEKEKILKLPKRDNNPVIIIKNEENYGFAKGNNTELKFALRRNYFEYIWLLNNDTIVEKNTLSYINYIKNKIPNAKIIVTVRDHHAVTASMIKRGDLYNRVYQPVIEYGI